MDSSFQVAIPLNQIKNWEIKKFNRVSIFNYLMHETKDEVLLR